MILTDDEIAAALGISKPFLAAVRDAHAIETAVIRKLSAGVSVEPFEVWTEDEPNSVIHGYTHEQLQTAIAAARVQENERCGKAADELCQEFGFEPGTFSDVFRSLLGKEAQS